MTISFDMAALLGFVFEAVLSGCYTTLFTLAVCLKFNGHDRKSRVKTPLFIITTILYLLCTAHFALGFAHFYIALNELQYTAGIQGFATLTNIVIAAAPIVLFAQIMGDVIVTYRCWVLWSRSYWVLIFPCLSAIVSIATLGKILSLLTHIPPDSQHAPPSLISWGIASFVILLCENAYVTALIVARIWYLSPRERRETLGGFPTKTGRVAIVITVESGMLYLVVQLVYCILFAIRHPAQDILEGIAVQVYGIAPTLIFIRMFGLLNSTSSRDPDGGIGPTPRPNSTRVVFNHSTIYSTVLSTTTSSDPGPLAAAEMSKSDWKPSGGDSGSNFASSENTSSAI